MEQTPERSVIYQPLELQAAELNARSGCDCGRKECIGTHVLRHFFVTTLRFSQPTGPLLFTATHWLSRN